MTDLEPGTRSWYRVGDGTASSKGRGWSKVFSYHASRWGRRRGPLRPRMVGDMGWGNRSDATISRLEALVDAGQIDAVLHAGDIGYADVPWRTGTSSCEDRRNRCSVPYMTFRATANCGSTASHKTRFAMR